MGAAVLGDILRFRPSGSGPGGTLVLLLVAAGLTGGVVLANRPPDDGRASQTVGADPPRAAVSIVQEQASPRPDPAPSPPPPPVPVTASSQPGLPVAAP